MQERIHAVNETPGCSTAYTEAFVLHDPLDDFTSCRDQDNRPKARRGMMASFHLNRDDGSFPPDT